MPKRDEGSPRPLLRSVDESLAFGVRYSRGRTSLFRARGGGTVPFTDVGRVRRLPVLALFFMVWLSPAVPSRDIYGTVYQIIIEWVA